MKVLAFGEVLWDIIEDKAHLGGAPLNFAAHIVQCGGEASILSRLGKDDLGNEAMRLIEKLGVGIDFIQTDENKPTGTVPVTLTNGQPDYYIVPDVAYDYLDFDEAQMNLENKHFDMLYFGTLAQRAKSKETLMGLLSRYDFKLKFCDINLRKECYSEEIIRFSLGEANIAKLNEDEVIEIGQMLFGSALSPSSFVRELLDYYPNLEHIILTAGGNGCYVYKDGTLHHIKSEPVKVVDAIGAGDSFSAAFMYAYFKTGDAIKSAQIGNKVGGFVASSAGAIPQYSEEIGNLIRTIK